MEKWKTTHGDTVRWADYKDAYINHLLQMKPLSFPVKTGGNHGIVNAHSKRNGPSWRMIVSLEKSGPKAWGTYPGGQSGNPGSPFYSNLLDHWVNGEYYQMQFLQNLPEGDTANPITTLNPE
jgi:penicillin amidase